MVFPQPCTYITHLCSVKFSFKGSHYKIGRTSAEADQMPSLMASDLVLLYLLMSNKKDARGKWVNDRECSAVRNHQLSMQG